MQIQLLYQYILLLYSSSILSEGSTIKGACNWCEHFKSKENCVGSQDFLLNECKWNDLDNSCQKVKALQCSEKPLDKCQEFNGDNEEEACTINDKNECVPVDITKYCAFYKTQWECYIKPGCNWNSTDCIKNECSQQKTKQECETMIEVENDEFMTCLWGKDEDKEVCKEAVLDEIKIDETLCRKYDYTRVIWNQGDKQCQKCKGTEIEVYAMMYKAMKILLLIFLLYL